METNLQRLHTLRQQRENMRRDYLSRAVYFIGHVDETIVERTLENYRPAVPTTVEGFFSALTGFVAGWAIVRLFAWPILRWKETLARRQFG
jgi:hypothetical protein